MNEGADCWQTRRVRARLSRSAIFALRISANRRAKLLAVDAAAAIRGVENAKDTGSASGGHAPARPT